MKKIIVFFAIVLMVNSIYAQAPTTNSVFEKAEYYFKVGEMEKGKALMDSVYLEAEMSDEPAVRIKARMTELESYFSYSSDDKIFLKAYDLINSEIALASGIELNVWNSLMAQLLVNYGLKNYSKIQDRTVLSGAKSNDFRIWSWDVFLNKINGFFLASLQNPEVLINTSVGDYELIIGNKETVRQERPTMYDLLAYRALDYFTKCKVSFTTPSVSFKTNNPDFFSDNDDFVNLTITSPDSSDLSFYALKIFQELTDLHIKNWNTQALIHTSLERLKFVMSLYSDFDEEMLEERFLLNLNELFEGETGSENITFALADFYYKQGSNYVAGLFDEYKDGYKKALPYLDKLIELDPSSNWLAYKAYTYEENIVQKSLSLTIDSDIIPDERSAFSISVKNMDSLFFKVIPMSRDYYVNRIKRVYSERRVNNRLRKKEAVSQWALGIPNIDDFQKHSFDAVLPALPCGTYLLAANPENNFEKGKCHPVYCFVSIDSLDYAVAEKTRSFDYFVCNRKYGTPVKFIPFHYEFCDYSYNYYLYTNSYQSISSGLVKSDEKGEVTIKKPSDYTHFEVRSKGRRVSNIWNQNHSSKSNPEREEEYRIVWFFSDRTIYRPGQTVCFKGILTFDYLKRQFNKDTIIYQEGIRILPNKKITVYLYGANEKYIDTMVVTTNEYGSFSGTFIIPENCLTGTFCLKAIKSNYYFQVEEYKRPKFEVIIDKPKGNYKLGKEVEITGKAESYSGYKIDGAIVNYTIERTIQYPFWEKSWGKLPASKPQSVKNSTTVTDKDGKFSFSFSAEADRDIIRKKPVFTYKIKVDVTDINGETQSKNSSVDVMVQAITLSSDIPEQLSLEEMGVPFGISAKNVAGEKVPAVVGVTIARLEMPEHFLHERSLPNPDINIIPREELQRLLPEDDCSVIFDKSKWKHVKLLTTAINTDASEALTLNGDIFTPGYYKLSMFTTDIYGDTVTEEAYFLIYNPAGNVCPAYQAIWLAVDKNQIFPGDTLHYHVGSYDTVYARIKVLANGEFIASENVKLSKNVLHFELPILKSYQGEICIYVVTNRQHRMYDQTVSVTVPFVSKILDFEFITFRDKLAPGSEEQWKLKIKGYKADSLAAELLCSMYDASLDAFIPNKFALNLYSSKNFYFRYVTNLSTTSDYVTMRGKELPIVHFNRSFYYRNSNEKMYDEIRWIYGYYNNNQDYSHLYSAKSVGGESIRTVRLSAGEVRRTPGRSITAALSESRGVSSFNGNITGIRGNRQDGQQTIIDGVRVRANGGVSMQSIEEADLIQGGIPSDYGDYEYSEEAAPETFSTISQVQIRSNFAETAFFFPQLQTDQEGNIILNFTMPESLTKWKFQGIAHTRDLRVGTFERFVQTEKALMVIPNSPRFFREGDRIFFSAKVVNLIREALPVEVTVSFFDAMNGKPLNLFSDSAMARQHVSVAKGESRNVQFPINIPYGVSAITYRIVASTVPDSLKPRRPFSDGEEMTIPVLSNRIRILEAMPFNVLNKDTVRLVFDRMKNNKSNSLQNLRYTFELSTNPGWYAVMSLPYLMRYPYECNEQIFNKMYSNLLASYILNQYPKLKNVLESWKNATPDQFLSQLEKNSELKSIVLEETPWVLDAKNDEANKADIALLFNMKLMAAQTQTALTKLCKGQNNGGGWSWFSGRSFINNYISPYIIARLGRLQKRGMLEPFMDSELKETIRTSVNHIDNAINDEYHYIRRIKDVVLSADHLDYTTIHNLYARSFFRENTYFYNQEAFDYFYKQAATYWQNKSFYMQGMLALAFWRSGDKTQAIKIMKAIRQHAITDNSGLYWPKIGRGYYWYESSVECQVLLIEAFSEITKDTATVEKMKLWLLTQKKTNDWGTTKATSDACYALLFYGKHNADTNAQISVIVGKEEFDIANSLNTENFAGYYKKSWKESDITPEMAEVKIEKPVDGIAMGALYWQYIDEVEKVTSDSSEFSIKKEIFRNDKNEMSEVLTLLSGNNSLKIGDKVTVRIIIQVNKNLEFIHLKDMRATAFEPLDIFSGYKTQNKLTYYQSTRDAATNFFIDELPKGIHVIEYQLIVSQKGNFKDGIATIQCMYAPEFSAHTSGGNMILVK